MPTIYDLERKARLWDAVVALEKAIVARQKLDTSALVGQYMGEAYSAASLDHIKAIASCREKMDSLMDEAVKEGRNGN